MGYTLLFDEPERLLSFRFHDDITSDDVISAIDEAEGHASYAKCDCQLIDLTEVLGSSVTTEGLISIGNRFHQGWLNRKGMALRIAMVVTTPKAYGQARQFISTAPILGARISLFRNIADAKNWLNSRLQRN
jgi:hypothetical protein